MTRADRRTIVFGLTLTALLGAGAGADTITLKGSVRLPPGGSEVRLADIAELAGPDALRYADLVVGALTGGSDPLEIALTHVRQRLTEAGVHWGKVQLTGRRVIVRPPAPGASGPPMAMTPLAIDAAGGSTPRAAALRRQTADAATLLDEGTVRGAVVRRIVKGLGVPAADLRLVFDAHDDELLATPLDGRRFEIQPLSSFTSDRLDLRIRTWSGGRVRDSRTVTVRPLVGVKAVILTREIARHQELLEEDLTLQERWLTPSQADAVCTLVGAVGRNAERRVKAGEVLKKSDLRREMIIERGDRVMVRCLVGGVVIALEAEARGDAAEGDQVELRKLGERETFMAVATGPGSAIVDLSR